MLSFLIIEDTKGRQASAGSYITTGSEGLPHTPAAKPKCIHRNVVACRTTATMYLQSIEATYALPSDASRLALRAALHRGQYFINTQYVGEKATQMPDNRTYVHPVPSRLRMRSMTETATAPREHRTRLFCDVRGG